MSDPFRGCPRPLQEFPQQLDLGDMFAHSSAPQLQVDLETHQAATSLDAATHKRIWFFQGMGLAAITLVGVYSIGGLAHHDGPEDPSAHDAALAFHHGLPAIKTRGGFQSRPAQTPRGITVMDDIPMSKPTDSNVVASSRPNFVCSFELPKKGIAEYGTVNMNFKPLLATESELVVVRSPLPLNLAAAPNGRVVSVTKDGEGGERVGDILRFTLKWTDRQPSMFDVCQVMERQLQTSFDEVVAALVSNDGMYADEIVMIFERPIAID